MRPVKRMILITTVVVVAASGGAAVQYGDFFPSAIIGNKGAVVASPAVKPTLIIAALPELTDTITEGPVISVTGFDRQSGMNSHVLEISNVRIGGQPQFQPKKTPPTGMRLAQVETDTTAGFLRPATPARSLNVTGQFSISAQGSDFANTPEDQTYDVASTAARPQTPPSESLRNIVLPVLPLTAIFAAQFPALTQAGIGIRLANLDKSYRQPVDQSALDQAPFGSACAPRFTATVKPGAMVRLDLSAPCHPYAKVTISQGRLRFTQRTSHTGTLSVLVPAFDETAVFMADFSSGQHLQATALVPSVKTVKRIAVLWDGQFDLDLHAFEFTDGSKGHVFVGRPRSVQQAKNYGGGYFVRLGDGTLTNPARAEIYTLPLGRNTPNGTVRMEVRAFGTADACSKMAVVTNLRSFGGKTAAAGSLRFALPECGALSEGVTLKDAVRDMYIALN